MVVFWEDEGIAGFMPGISGCREDRKRFRVVSTNTKVSDLRSGQIDTSARLS